MDGRNVKKKPYSDRRWYDDVGGRSPYCCFCKHWHYDWDRKIDVCTAFPKGIPDKFMNAYEGDRDVTEECAPGIKLDPDDRFRRIFKHTEI